MLLDRGGVDVEIAPAPILRLAPLCPTDAREMVTALPAALLRGYRGAAPLDVGAVVTVLLAAASLIVSTPDIAELDINPLRLSPDGPLALDALVVRTYDGRSATGRRHGPSGGLL